MDKTVGNVHIKLKDDIIDVNRAQRLLNMQIVADSTPYVPFRNGALRSSVRYPQGISGGEIEWNTPYAHYLYEGNKYNPNIPIKDKNGNITGWYSPPVKYPTGEPLMYHHPGTGSHWFETAKEEHLDDWTELVKENIIKH